MYNNGVQFVKIFETVPEINEFCVAKNCIPISITPIVVRNEYKALGATSKATVIIPKYNYAVILKPIECGCDQADESCDSQSQVDKVLIEAGAEKAVADEHLGSDVHNIFNILGNPTVVSEGQSNHKRSKGSTEKLLNNVRYQDIAEELHYGPKEREKSLNWFKEHKGDKPLSSYITTMGLADWQIAILEALIG